MNRHQATLQSITEKLEFYGYRYSIDTYRNEPVETILKIYLPLLCYLKVSFLEKGIRISSRVYHGFNFLSLEYNFLIYALGLTLLALIKGSMLPMVIYIFPAVMLLHFVVCIIKTESLKTLLHGWIEKDLNISSGLK